MFVIFVKNITGYELIQMNRFLSFLDNVDYDAGNVNSSFVNAKLNATVCCLQYG